MTLLWTIGDSWTDTADGTHAGFDPGEVDGWAEQTAAALGVGLLNTAKGGAGYLAHGAWGLTFGGQVARFPCPSAAVAVVWGSVNDYTTGADPQGVEQAAEAVLRMVQRAAPGATLIVLGPQYWAAPIPAGMYPLRDAVAQAAARVGVQFVDTLAWMQDHPELVGGNNHPNADGYTWLATEKIGPLVAAALAGRDAPPVDRCQAGGAAFPLTFPADLGERAA